MMKPFRYNRPQIAIKLSSASHKMIVAGRGIGKTTIQADDSIDNLRLMPRGKEGFIGMTYFHIKTKSMPVIINHWEKLGYIKDLHYFVGRKPPKSWKWPEAYQPPLDYKNCLIFWNGFTVEFISMDRPEMARSGSYDFLRGDEAAKIKHNALVTDIFPANRGNNDRFGHINKHHGTMFTTTHALDLTGEWIYDYKKYAEQDKDYFYLEASARENFDVLGEKFFRDAKRTMPQIFYDLEIENIRPEKKSDVFYPKFSDDLHTYEPSYNYTLIDDFDEDDIDYSEHLFDCRIDKDLIASNPLDVSFDLGSRINCCVVGQDSYLNSYKILRNFYTEEPLVTRDLVNKLIEHYKYHPTKVIYLYGGSDGHKRADYDSNLSHFQKITNQLNAAGWSVIPKYQNFEIFHKDKFEFFNDWMSGNSPHLPDLMINKENAKELLFSMKHAPMKKSEIKKDKSSERKDIPQWQATHLSDAFDNLTYWKFSPAAISASTFMPTSIR